MQGFIKNIYIASVASAEMKTVEYAQLVRNRGIEGDRYFNRTGKWSPDDDKPDFNLTLIEQEKIQEFSDQGINLSAAQFRRNIVTEGLDLNLLVGKRFLLGNVLCKGIRLCEPCKYLEDLMSQRLVKVMTHKGGLRAQIINGGQIMPGNTIIPLDQTASVELDEDLAQHV